MWYKDAILYELHVRAFCDSVGDGFGDFRGLTQKLDYLQDLGVTTLWLLPFYPSPLRDDGYDIADYTNIHPDYGTLRDFKGFLDAAHHRGLRVITELVINHTSDQHPWFQRARRAPPGSSERNFYVWSDTAERYRDARIIFKDFEPSNWTWDPVAHAYYWHRFYHHQPDLNYDHPDVWKAVFPLLDFWMDLGVDGLRLDAVPYLFEREGTNCENLPETHDFLRALRRHVDERYRDRLLLAEANQWPEDAAAYFGAGDECHMNFHFPVMPRLFMSIHMEDRFPIVDIMAQTPAIPDNCQWAMFLRNHDELTLEMVTDEERDYMYRAYAVDPRARINLGIRRRLAPLLGNNRRRIELMNGLLFSMPGTPILYYGDEIGMGDNIYLGDRNGVRTPMQWSGDRNAGFSRCNPQRLYLPVIIDPEYHYEAVNVEAQQNNPNSLLWWMKRLIALRKRYKAFGRGSLEFLRPENRRILAFLRRHEDETLLVVANLSRFVQYVEMDLSAFEGWSPVELFGRTVFPRVGKLPYLLTLGPHAFYWFDLQAPQRVVELDGAWQGGEAELPLVPVSTDWQELLETAAGRDRLEELLPAYVLRRGWVGARRGQLKAAFLREVFPLSRGDETSFLSLVGAEFNEAQPETYVLPLAYATGEQAARLQREQRLDVVARVAGPDGEGVLFDALGDPRFCASVLRAMARGSVIEGEAGAILRTASFTCFARLHGPEGETPAPSVRQTEEGNTLVVYGERLILKVFRRVDEGPNPELEAGRHLTERGFAHSAPTAGAVEYLRGRRAEPMTLAVLAGLVPHEGDAWQYTLDELSRYFERALATREGLRLPGGGGEDQTIVETTARAQEMIDPYLESARLLGRRTAELHLALAASDDPAFAPEAISPHYQRGLYQSMRNLTGRVFRRLRPFRGSGLPETDPADVGRLLALEEALLSRFHAVVQLKATSWRIRGHGNLHLGEILYTGKDFVFIDFEGDPRRTLGERRMKRSPLRDVAGMLRSFHQAVYSSLHGGGGNGRDRLPGIIRTEDLAALEPWARFWYTWVSATFVKAYRETLEEARASFLPKSRDEFRVLLDSFLLEKTLSDLGHELEHNPRRARVPLLGLLEMMTG